MPFVLLITALLAVAQVATIGAQPAPPQQPSWMEVFKKVYGPQAQGAALGSLDQEVAKSWAAALAAGAQHPFFGTAAHQTAQYYASQGYDRKAETIFRQAIAAAKQAGTESADLGMARTFTLALAQRWSIEQRFVAAAGLIQGLLEELKTAPDHETRDMRLSVLIQLAHLREQTGDLDAAEALLREVKTLQSALQSAPPSQDSSATGQNRRMAFAGTSVRMMAGGFARGYGGSGSGDLASFYQRQGESAKAESVFQKDLEEATAPEQVVRARQSYAQFLSSQQRWEESAAQWEKLLQMQSASSGPEARQMLASSRVNLAQAWMSAGKTEKALEIARQQVAQPTEDAYQNTQSLRFYGSILMQQKNFEEAEKVVEQMRQPTGKNAAEISKHAESMADHLLADIRQMQDRGEEARALREKTMAQPPKAPDAAAPPVPLWNLVQPIQELMGRHKYDEAITQLYRILADATPRIHSNPEEISAFSNFIHSLPPGRSEERLLLMRSILSTLDGVRPADHPRVAQALGQFLGSAMEAGLNAGEISRLLNTEEKILVASKGEDSPALNDVSRQRARYFSNRGEHAEAALEIKRALKRTEAVSGAKSQATLQMMRELLNSLQMNSESWTEEERLRLAVIEASAPLLRGNVMHDMHLLAGRYFAVGQRENALAWMDRALELARKSPQGTSVVPMFEQQRNHFANDQFSPQAGPGRWFNSPELSTSPGARLGGRPVPAGVIRITPGSPVPPPPPQ